MKNVMLGIIGVCITIYVMLIGLNVYVIQTHKNQLENTLSRAVEQALEQGYENKDTQAVWQMLQQDLAGGAGQGATRTFSIVAIDLEKGLLSVTLTESFPILTGQRRSYTLEKTAIVERQEMNEAMVMVTFMADGEVYKEYQLAQGETCPMPKLPSDAYVGWAEYGGVSQNLVTAIEEVWSDKIYIAVER